MRKDKQEMKMRKEDDMNEDVLSRETHLPNFVVHI